MRCTQQARSPSLEPLLSYTLPSPQTPVWLNGEYIKGVELLAKATPVQVSADGNMRVLNKRVTCKGNMWVFIMGIRDSRCREIMAIKG